MREQISQFAKAAKNSEPLIVSEIQDSGGNSQIEQAADMARVLQFVWQRWEFTDWVGGDVGQSGRMSPLC